MRKIPLAGLATLLWATFGCPSEGPPCRNHDDCAAGEVCVIGSADEPARCVPEPEEKDAGQISPSPDAGSLDDGGEKPDGGPYDGGSNEPDAGPAWEGLRLIGEVVPGAGVAQGGSFRLEGKLGPPLASEPLTGGAYRLRLVPPLVGWSP